MKFRLEKLNVCVYSHGKNWMGLGDCGYLNGMILKLINLIELLKYWLKNDDFQIRIKKRKRNSGMENIDRKSSKLVESAWVAERHKSNRVSGEIDSWIACFQVIHMSSRSTNINSTNEMAFLFKLPNSKCTICIHKSRSSQWLLLNNRYLVPMCITTSTNLSRIRYTIHK